MGPSIPDAPPPPAQRQLMKEPELKDRRRDGGLRRRGYQALMINPRPALQAPPTTTATLGGGSAISWGGG